MNGKFELSNLSVGNDISEVRNQFHTIREYLEIESVSSDMGNKLIDFTLSKHHKLEDLPTSEIESGTYTPKEPDDKAQSKAFLKKLVENEAMRASLGVLMLPIWKGLLDSLVKVMAERPVKVNAIQTFLVEMIYDISNKEKPQRPTYTINEDGKRVSPTYLPKKQSRMDMLFPDFSRRFIIRRDFF